jgi:CO dehydrogenase maturation factor
MLITISGKGGVGKTTVTALLVDELLRQQYPGRLLVVDADPAQTLHLALGVAEPGSTLAQIRETTSLKAGDIRALPMGLTPAEAVRRKLVNSQVIVTRHLNQQPFDFMAMGHGEGQGCYCAVNGALSEALTTIMDSYDLIIIDNEAGLEHLSRYRIKQVDLFLVVVRPGRAAVTVGRQIQGLAEQVGMTLSEVGYILNHTSAVSITPPVEPLLASMPVSMQLARIEMTGEGAVTNLSPDAPARLALRPVIERIEAVDVRYLVY